MSFGKSSAFGSGSKSGFGGGNDDIPNVAINLTALMDILSNLLFFLLASYAAANTQIKGADGMQLPASSSEAQATLSILVRVTLDKVEVEGRPVVYIKNGAFQAPIDGDKIVPLFKELTRIGTEGKDGVKMTDDNTVLLVLADKRMDYSLISKVLKTAGYAGFPNFRFAVLKR
jgi:biopolymer transport protein ExbD